MCRKKYICVVLLCSLSFFIISCDKNVGSLIEISNTGKEHNQKMNHRIVSVEQEFTRVSIEANDLSVSIEKAEKSGYTIFSKKKHDNVKNYFEIEQENSHDETILRFIQKNAEDESFHLVIYSTHPEQLECDFFGKNTVFVTKENLKELKFELKDGTVDLIGETSYPINMDIEDVVTDIRFKDCNATVLIESDGGTLTLFGTQKNLVEGENVLHHQKFGEGRDFIRLHAKNSTVELSH